MFLSLNIDMKKLQTNTIINAHLLPKSLTSSGWWLENAPLLQDSTKPIHNVKQK